MIAPVRAKIRNAGFLCALACCCRSVTVNDDALPPPEEPNTGEEGPVVPSSSPSVPSLPSVPSSRGGSGGGGAAAAAPGSPAAGMAAENGDGGIGPGPDPSSDPEPPAAPGDPADPGEPAEPGDPSDPGEPAEPAGPDASQLAVSPDLEDVELMLTGLSSIELPAVGSGGVSLLEYASAESATVVFTDWEGGLSTWYQSSSAYYAYTAGSGSHHVALLYQQSGYGLYADGSAAELSGARNQYKEFLTANSGGFAWVNYTPEPGKGGNAPALGEVVFRTWQGEQRALTDAARYRARPDLSDQYLAFVEYADTTGAPGQIVVVPLSGGEPIVAAPSDHHQDRPAVDGDWVVWEEYVGPEDAVIRARHLRTGVVVDVSSRVGFRTNPDIRGGRVVWEDQTGGTGDIHLALLAAEPSNSDSAVSEPDHVLVGGTAYSAAARLSDDRVVWMQVLGAEIGLWQARFR
jgi:hypothetical protein